MPLWYHHSSFSSIIFFSYFFEPAIDFSSVYFHGGILGKIAEKASDSSTSDGDCDYE